MSVLLRAISSGVDPSASSSSLTSTAPPAKDVDYWRQEYVRMKKERDDALNEVQLWKARFFLEKKRKHSVSKSLFNMMIQSYDGPPSPSILAVNTATASVTSSYNYNNHCNSLAAPSSLTIAPSTASSTPSYSTNSQFLYSSSPSKTSNANNNNNNNLNKFAAAAMISTPTPATTASCDTFGAPSPISCETPTDFSEQLLSPTLSSFDFDDDKSSEGEEEADERSLPPLNFEQEANSPTASPSPNGDTPFEFELNHRILPPPPPSPLPGAATLPIQQTRVQRSSTVGSYDCYRSSLMESGRKSMSESSSGAIASHAAAGFASKEPTGAGTEATGGSKSEASKNNNMIYRMLYSKSSNSDLWHTHVQPHHLHGVARTVLLSMQMTKARLFEHFFVCGMNPEDHKSVKTGFWNPTLLYQYPMAKGRHAQTACSSVVDFCFPQGVPAIVCSATQAEQLAGFSLSEWSTAPEYLREHIDEKWKTDGYTFRLTGAKGEVLYGFCLSVLWHTQLMAPSTNKSSSKAAALLTARCFCFTSKFPFYRLHFFLLNSIIENECRCAMERDYHEYEVTITSENTSPLLGVSFVPRKLVILEEKHHSLRDSISEKSLELSEDNPLAIEELETPVHQQVRRISTRPTVERVDKAKVHTELYHALEVGDVLDSVNGKSTLNATFADVMLALSTSERPLQLRFRRLRNRCVFYDPTCLSPLSLSILESSREMKIGIPGAVSSVYLPSFNLKYQFPRKPTERWACGVALRLLPATSVVNILANLLLEKQVVLCGANSAKVSAVCTAFMLLLEPFEWQSTYIPLLPSKLLEFLHSPVPFLVGCHDNLPMEEWPDVCFYNIDNNTFALPASTPFIVDKSILPNGNELCSVISKHRHDLLMQDGVETSWHELSEQEDTIVTQLLQETQHLLDQMCSHVSKLCQSMSSSPEKSFYNTLQEQLAKEITNSQQHQTFWEEFVQTQLFCQFCEKILKSTATPMSSSSTNATSTAVSSTKAAT